MAKIAKIKLIICQFWVMVLSAMFRMLSLGFYISTVGNT